MGDAGTFKVSGTDTKTFEVSLDSDARDRAIGGQYKVEYQWTIKAVKDGKTTTTTDTTSGDMISIDIDADTTYTVDCRIVFTTK